MKSKYFFMIITMFCIAMLISMPIVKAAETEDSLDREMVIACALAYLPQQEGKSVGMDQRYLAYIRPLKNVFDVVNEQFNLHNYASSDELDGWVVADFHNNELTERSLAAYVLEKDNDVIIIFRATDTEVIGDIVYGIKNTHPQEEYALKYTFEILDRYSKKEGNYNIHITGHSLGGYLAQVVGAAVEQNIDNYENLNLKKVVTFNGIGINFFTLFGDKFNYGNKQETIETLKVLGNDGRLVEYFTFGDVVSALGVHYGEMRMITPSIDSITYQRSNFSLVRNIRQNTKPINALLKEFAKDRFFNIFKTEIETATKLYGTESLIEYILLTHETDAFVSIENEKSINAPVLKIVENKNVLADAAKYFCKIEKDLSKIETKKSTTIRALTNFASAKKYVWEVSSDKQNWEVVKVSTIDMNDPDYNPNELPSSEFEIDINTFKEGETKYYRVTSYYDDNYVSMKYNYNEEKGINGEYEYVVNEELSKQDEPDTLQKTIEVKRPAEPKIVQTIKAKIQKVTNALKNLFKRK